MALLAYIDNEKPWASETDPTTEWTSRWQEGASTIERVAPAAWPLRGAWGVRQTIAASSAAYLSKNISAQTPLGVGFWFRISAAPVWSDTNYFGFCQIFNVSKTSALIYLRNVAGSIEFRVWSYCVDKGQVWMSATGLVVGPWYYFALLGSWTNPAGAAVSVWLNGRLLGSTPTNAGNATVNVPTTVRVGNFLVNGTSIRVDFDEIKITTGEYPEPHRQFQAGPCMAAVQPALATAVVGGWRLARK